MKADSGENGWLMKEYRRAQDRFVSVTHLIATGSGLTLCCGRNPTELSPWYERLTTNEGLVTCKGWKNMNVTGYSYEKTPLEYVVPLPSGARARMWLPERLTRKDAERLTAILEALALHHKEPEDPMVESVSTPKEE